MGCGSILLYDTLSYNVSGCLKLLPPEELQHLDFPRNKDSSAPIKKVKYMSDSDTPDDTNSRPELGTTRFNLFTGYQTLKQREQSFKVQSLLT